MAGADSWSFGSWKSFGTAGIGRLGGQNGSRSNNARRRAWNDSRGKEGDLRFFAGHGLRVVRFLSLRIAGGVDRRQLLHAISGSDPQPVRAARIRGWLSRAP